MEIHVEWMKYARNVYSDCIENCQIGLFLSMSHEYKKLYDIVYRQLLRDNAKVTTSGSEDEKSAAIGLLEEFIILLV